MIVLGIDPGTRKCGYALIDAGANVPITLGIALLPDLAATVASLVAQHAVDVAALGRGTNSAHVASILATLGIPHVLVDERETTLRARARFFDAHPPRGWKRFVPRGMLLPDRPIDDFAAVLIAERYLAGS